MEWQRYNWRAVVPLWVALALRLVLTGTSFAAGSRFAAAAAGVAAPVQQAPAVPSPGETARDTVGVIDFYGLRTVAVPQAQKALGLKEGDPVPELEAEIAAAVLRLEELPGVKRARLTRLCCDERGRTILYVGIEETGAPHFRYHPAPTGRVSLPPELVDTSHRFDQLLQAAVEKGDIGEDDSQGHTLSNNPALRKLQEGLVAHAARHLKTLRRVLRTAADPEQRQIAAWIIGYAPDKRGVVADLLSAVRDPDGGVRNNATRSLMSIAILAQHHPEQKIRIPAAPFVAMLSSLVWEDRNKAAAVLLWLTASRPAPALAALRAAALPALIEMARWKHPGHAQAAFILLGRVAGLAENAIGEAWARGDREAVIARALESRP